MKKFRFSKSEKNRIKLPIRIYALYLLIATFLLTGVTFSKYVATSGGEDEARIATFGELSIREYAQDGTGLMPMDKEGNSVQTMKMIPGVPLTKKVVVNYGAEKVSEVSAYVFVELKPYDWAAGKDDFSYILEEEDETLLSFSIDNGKWMYLERPGDTRSHVYYKLVEAGEVLDEISIIKENEIFVSEQVTSTNLSKVKTTIAFSAQAVQAGGFENASDAWNSIH